MHKIGFSTLLLLGLSQLVGCASQQTQEQIVVVQQSQQALIEQQHAQIVAQRDLLAQMNERQLQTLEVLEINSGELTKLSQREPTVKIIQVPAKPAVNRSKAAEDKGTPGSPAKITLGRVEWVWVDKLNNYVKARVDTGARSSSIHATNIQYFERDGKDWVRFKMNTHDNTQLTPNEGGEAAEAATEPFYEVPVERMVRIRQASAADYEKRPVIKLRVKIDQLEDDAEFTLTNRSSMIYPVLLGRSFIRDVAIVDVGHAFIHKRNKVTIDEN